MSSIRDLDRDAGAFDYEESRPQAPGPLFAEPGPWDDATAPEDRIRRLLGEIIWRHKGRKDAISIGALKQRTGMRTDREVKRAVELLVMESGMLIGGWRGSAGDQEGGYFVVLDREDLQVAIGAFQAQVATMQKRIRRVESLAKARGILED